MGSASSAREHRRSAALRGFSQLDFGPEKAYDDSTRIAAAICDVPIAMVSLVDERRQWLKSAHELTVSETPRDWEFCAYAIQQTDVFIVPDASLDRRFASNPLVAGDPRIRYYAGAPLIDEAGHALGALCVIDYRPRQLPLEKIKALSALSRRVMAQFALNRTATHLAAALSEVKTLRDLLPVCAWCHNVRDDEGYWHTWEAFLVREQEIDISHGICPACYERHAARLVRRVGGSHSQSQQEDD